MPEPTRGPGDFARLEESLLDEDLEGRDAATDAVLERSLRLRPRQSASADQVFEEVSDRIHRN
ncbi:MAG: hypothetical protein JKY65_26975 [Planctomycetes bacterium]|nr:hypothetical protein [Planctomycetota bacterium]